MRMETLIIILIVKKKIEYGLPSKQWCETGKLPKGEKYNQNIHGSVATTYEERCPYGHKPEEIGTNIPSDQSTQNETVEKGLIIPESPIQHSTSANESKPGTLVKKNYQNVNQVKNTKWL